MKKHWLTPAAWTVAAVVMTNILTAYGLAVGLAPGRVVELPFWVLVGLGVLALVFTGLAIKAWKRYLRLL